MSVIAVFLDKKVKHGKKPSITVIRDQGQPMTPGCLFEIRIRDGAGRNEMFDSLYQLVEYLEESRK